MNQYKIGWCYICDQGWVSIVKTKEGKYYCLCKECESEWDDPNDFINRKEGTYDKYTSAREPDTNDFIMERWAHFIVRE